jgi:hypothetical protein
MGSSGSVADELLIEVSGFELNTVHRLFRPTVVERPTSTSRGAGRGLGRFCARQVLR